MRSRPESSDPTPDGARQPSGRPREDRPQGGRRRRPAHRRARGLPGTLGVTTLGAALPGAGFLWTGRRVLGVAVLLPAVLIAALAAVVVMRGPRAALSTVFDPARLHVAAVLAAALLLAWVCVVVATYLLARPREASTLQRVGGVAFVAVLCLAVAAPVALAARYATVQADLVNTVFRHNRSATVPEHVTQADPWGGRRRVNVLLLGGDGGVHRMGIRTDSMILASTDVRTGHTVLFSLPRNLMNAPFPKGSPLAAIYPHGFTGPGDDGNWMLNAVYRMVPMLHPGVLGHSTNEGADALKQAVEGTLGTHVDYYLLVNLAGFRQIVNAMGGVTVNINQPVPIGGNTDLGIPPDSYLKPGPAQRLNGQQALWFSRGRYGSDDFARMERQRCMVNAIVDEAKPVRLLQRYQALAATGKRIMRTDIPNTLLPAFVDLAAKVKASGMRSIVFEPSARFSSADPDFAWMHSVVRRALKPPHHTKHDGPTPGTPPTSTPKGPGQPVSLSDPCGYHPLS